MSEVPRKTPPVEPMPGAGRGTPLPDRARVVVVGGGIAGCSVLFHLARLGWTDTLLVEKGELTCGSTWHAAGLCTQFHSSRPMTKLLMRSLEIYRELRDPSGLPVDMRTVGSIRLATTPERVDEVRARQGLAETLGLPYEVVGPDEVSNLFPLATVEDVLAAAYLPTDGYVDPTAVTQAFANNARESGAKISQRTSVTGFNRTPDGWIVETDRGEVECEHVVNCAGMWARQVGAFAGARLPIVPLEHHYVVTEGIDGVRNLGKELPVLRDPEASFYVRGEGDALLVGPFEFTPKSWSEHRVPDDFEGRLLPANVERIMPVLLDAAKRVPELEDAGLKTLLNGPDGYTPDGLCLMGEVAGLRGFHVLAGFSIFGIVFGGGAGEYLAQWIVNGQPNESMWDLDVRRFGPDADSFKHRVPRAIETYAREYKIHYEDEETLAGRPLKTDPLYDMLAKRGAVFGSRFGWERPLWFSALASRLSTSRRCVSPAGTSRWDGSAEGSGKGSGFWTSRASRSSWSAVPAPTTGSRDSAPTGCRRRSAGSPSPRCSTTPGASSATSRWPGWTRTPSTWSRLLPARSTTSPGYGRTCQRATGSKSGTSPRDTGC